MEITIPNRSAKNNPIGMYAKDVIQMVRLANMTTVADEILLGKMNFNMISNRMNSIVESNV